MFNLENEIQHWLSELRSNPGFEDGDIAEMEDHILDSIEIHIEAGLSEQEAFEKATTSFGALDKTSSEMVKSRTADMSTPKTDFLAHNYTNSTNIITSSTMMFNNYLKIAARNVRKQKLFSFINILSLTIGLAATLLIFLFVHDEINFDKFNTNKADIHRVLQVQNNVDGSLAYKGTSHAISLGPELVREIPGIISYTRFFEHWSNEDSYVKANNKTFREPVLYGDFTIFKMFSLPVISGSTEGHSAHEVVLSKKTARKYFADEDPVGETISIRIDDEFVDFTVAAVIENIPANSSVQFDLLVNFSYLTEVGFLKEYITNWGFGAINTYVQKGPAAVIENMQPVLDKMLLTHYPYYAEIAEQRGYKTAMDYRQLNLQPLMDIHFDSSVTNGLLPASNKLYSILLGLIALGILLIGCINFMNLSIGRSSNRAKEIGLRKTIGANRKQLVGQFLSESIVLAVVALFLALLSVKLLLPVFNMLTGKELSLALLFEPIYLLIILGITLFTGLISGIYPAFALSNFKIEDAFSGNLKLGGSNTFTRILVVFQFTLATLLIIGMLVVTAQMSYIQNKDLGFSGEQVVVIPNSSINQTTIFSHYKQALNGVPGVLNVASADQNFGDKHGLGGMGFEYKGKEMRTGIINVSADYLKTMEIELLSGRDFDAQISTDYSHAVIVNESGLRDFELQQDGIFETLGRTGKTEDDPVVIGVMKDFHFNSLTVDVEPMLIRLSKNENLNYVMVKISPENMPSTIASLNEAWGGIAQDLPFEYTFLDDTMARQYAAQKEWRKIISISMITAIILSCFGLFGLVAMAIAGRRSEIGVRKVLGATVVQIVSFYSWKYTRLVLLSFLIAMPVSYYYLEKWLETFAFRIDLGVQIYFVAGIITLGIAFLTVVYKILEAALSNPAQVLRDE
jgi:putative ABC transport system permease protein